MSKIDTVEVTPTAKHGERPARDKMVPRKRRGKQAIGGPGVSVSARLLLVPAFRTSVVKLLLRRWGIDWVFHNSRNIVLHTARCYGQ